MLLGAGGVRALALCALPAPLFVLGTGVTIALTARELLREHRPRRLGVDADGRWRLATAGGERFVGRPSGRGYRSAALVVLELVDEGDPSSRERVRPRVFGGRFPRAIARPRRRQITVFADGVDAEDFSFLQLSLAFPSAAR